MARPTDNSLKYYNQDTEDDDNLQYIEAMHGLTGYAIVHKLWKHIYGGPGGYYCPWNKINKMLFCKNNGIELSLLDEILETCFSSEIGIFDKNLAQEKQILTSKGIQKRWTKIVKEAGRRSNKVEELHRLISFDTDVLPDNPQLTTPPVELIGTETPQSKVKESKVKESKVKDAPGALDDLKISIQDLIKSSFSESFFPVWQRWKDYKLREFKFKYKSEDSESEAVNELVKISGGLEICAIAIVKKSMGQGWKGFFELKEPIKKTALPAAAIAATSVEGSKKKTLNYLYERYCENPTQVTISSIDVEDYHFLKRSGLVNFTEAKTKDIRDHTLEYLLEKKKEQNETNVTTYMKRFGVIEFFRMYNADNKTAVFST